MKRKYLYIIIIVWTSVVMTSILWNIGTAKKDLIEEEKNTMRTYYALLETTRQWNLNHEGFYAEITEKSKANPYLESDKAVIETKNGMKLTYLNMHIMTKQLSELVNSSYGVKFRITSLNPLDITNNPDSWEKRILSELDKSKSEAFEFTEDDSVPKFRYFAPLYVEESCLECHTGRQHKKGDILGGVSIVKSSYLYYSRLKDHNLNDIIVHAIVYFIVFIGILHYNRLVNKYGDRLKKSLKEERELYDNAPFGYHTLDANGYIIRMNNKELNWLGYTEEELVGKKKYIDLISPDSREEYNSKCMCIAENKNRQTLEDSEFNLMRKNGTSFPILLSSIAMRDSAGKIKSFLNSVLDITERKNADLIIQESERKYRNIFNNVQDVFYQTDMSGILIEISPSIERYSGYTRDELVGKPVEEFYDDPSVRYDLLKVLTQKGEIGDFELMLKRKDGTRVLTSANIHILFNKKGLPIGIEGSLRDISERKLIEEAVKSNEQLLKAIFESTSSGILVVDQNRRIKQFNARFKEMWNIPEETINSYKDGELIKFVLNQLKDPEEFTNKVNTIYETVTNVSDIIELTDERYFQRISIPLFNGSDIIGRVWNFNDITEQKKAELVLREANASKDKFFSILAHDLRSPISGFVGISEILSKELDELSVREVKEMSSAIYKSANSIFNLLNDLLKWAQSQSDELRLNPEEFDLTELINETAVLLKTSAVNKNISIKATFENELLINCDKNMITTVVRNLITNAIKFTPKGGVIEVTAIKEITPKGNFVKVNVKDSGIGIGPETITKLFKVGEMRTSPGTSGEKGTGLGLILCKEFIEKHGGSIAVESKINEGSTFSFTLPIKATEENGLFN